MSVPAALPSVPLANATRMSFDFKLRHTRFENGDGDPRPNGEEPIAQVWDVVWEDITTAQHVSLLNFFIGRANTAPISWTPPGQTTSLLFVATSDYTASYIGYEQWNANVTLEQIFDYDLT